MNKSLSFLRSLIIVLSIIYFTANNFIKAQSPWTQVTSLAPDTNGGVMILLTDGSVICKAYAGIPDGIGNVWNKLTPDANGSYVNGTWSAIAPMISTRLYFSSQVMKDGRVYVAGGEYGSGGSLGEVYNPITNSWSATANPGLFISDANSEILPDGRILQACVTGNLKVMRFYNPSNNSYSLAPSSIGIHNESSWVKLADNSILFVDRLSTNSERYLPATNQWTADANVPVNLYDPFGDETGAGILLPDGRAFFIGASDKTAIYIPSGNNSPGTWAAGALIPNGRGVPDGSAAMMVNGKILCVASPSPITGNVFQSPTYYYEYDYVSNTFSQVVAPSGSLSVNEPCFVSNMLDLPNGQVLYSKQGYKDYYVYTPSGAPLAVGKPTITNMMQSGCNSFTLTGLLFNGITEGAYYGDDWQNNTNYPIIRLTNGPNVYYARTFNWNRTAVQTGLLPDTTQFTLPVGLPPANYSLYVTANGIASDPIAFPYFPPVLSSTLNPPSICSGSPFTYTPTSNAVTPSFVWTRAAVAGISNTAIVTPQPSNPNEVLTNTTALTQTVIYTYTVTSNGCSGVQQVTVNVIPLPSITVVGTQSICAGNVATLSASGATSYVWSNGPTTSSISVTPTVTSVYTVTGTGSCSASQQATVIVNPLPGLFILGTQTICVGDSINITASGSITYSWNTGSTNFSIGVTPQATTVYIVTTTDGLGCSKTDSIKIHVNACVGVNEISLNNIQNAYVYPNPVEEFATVVFNASAKENYSIKLFDVFGRLVNEENSETMVGENAHVIYFKDMTPGLYFTVLQKGNDIYKTKIVLK